MDQRKESSWQFTRYYIQELKQVDNMCQEKEAEELAA